jgi:hypothetical protein
MEANRTPRAGRIETVGAWFHLWTPRRGVEIPPAPWGRIAIVTGVAVAATAVLVVLLANDAQQEEKRAAAQASHAEIVAAAKQRAVLRVDQAVHRGQGKRLPPSRAAQATLVADLEHGITADAQARFKAHKLDTHVRSTQCKPFVRPSVPHPPPPSLAARTGRYECLAVTASVPASGRTEAASVGYPFWGTIDFVTGALVWCKVNPRPAEHGTYDELAFVPLPKQCDFVPRAG